MSSRRFVLQTFLSDMLSLKYPITNRIWISGRYDGWNIPNSCILFPACTAIVLIPMGCPLSNCCLGSSSKVVLPWVPSISDDKQNHPSRCLQQGSPHHPFESGYAIPLNSAKRSIVIALGWYKEFQWSCIKSNSLIILRVTVPKVSRCGIMATQLLATLTIVYHLFKCGIVVYLVIPPSFVPLLSARGVLRLSAREMLLCLIPWVNPELFDLREEQFF